MWAGSKAECAPHRDAQRSREVRGQRRCDAMRCSSKVEEAKRTLGDVLETLVSHDCGVELAKISRSKRCLDLEIRKRWWGSEKKIRRRLGECCEVLLKLESPYKKKIDSRVSVGTLRTTESKRPFGILVVDCLELVVDGEERPEQGGREVIKIRFGGEFMNASGINLPLLPTLSGAKRPPIHFSVLLIVSRLWSNRSYGTE